MYEELAELFKDGERGEYRVELAKDTVFQLRAMALMESARTGKNVTWTALLQAAADQLLHRKAKVMK